MFSIKRTNSGDPAFINLIKFLDQELWKQYGNEQSKYDEHNFLLNNEKSIVVFDKEIAIACGAFRELIEQNSVEIKRMFVSEDYRNKGLGKLLLTELEKWAIELNYKYAILETGFKQIEAISLYTKLSYSKIPNYPPYENMLESVCMKKYLR
jgi:putative acetyltransferase